VVHSIERREYQSLLCSDHDRTPKEWAQIYGRYITFSDPFSKRTDLQQPPARCLIRFPIRWALSKRTQGASARTS